MLRTLSALLCLSVLAAAPTFGQHINGVGIPTAGTQPTENGAVGTPLETREQNNPDQKPAFPGQTRAPGVRTQTPLKMEIVANGLKKPWSLNFLPDGRILITEKPGAMRIITQKGEVGPDIKNVPAVVFIQDGGLMDLTLDPHFADNHMVYFAYVEQKSREDYNGTVVAKARLSDDFSALENVTKILVIAPEAKATAHYGCRLMFDKDGTSLFVTNGERFFPPTKDQAQDPHSQMGKILRITTDGKPAKGNPFESNGKGLPEVWSFGHRNPQGLAYNPVSGELWSSEHGPQGGDEINLIEPGKNYGWPIIAYGNDYDGSQIGDGSSAKPGMEQPLYYWEPAVAPSGICFYTADLIPEWKNNLFVACLVGEHIDRLVLDGHKVVGEERLLMSEKMRFRDVKQGPDGALWCVTDQMPDGRLYRISPK